MQSFTLLMVPFSTEPFSQPSSRKVADVFVREDGTCRVTFVRDWISPQAYDSIDQLKAVHCGDGSKVRLGI